MSESDFRKPPYLLIDKINEIIDEVNRLNEMIK